MVFFPVNGEGTVGNAVRIASQHCAEERMDSGIFFRSIVAERDVHEFPVPVRNADLLQDAAQIKDRHIGAARVVFQDITLIGSAFR